MEIFQLPKRILNGLSSLIFLGAHRITKRIDLMTFVFTELNDWIDFESYLYIIQWIYDIKRIDSSKRL